jgi:hypothetical protein
MMDNEFEDDDNLHQEKPRAKKEGVSSQLRSHDRNNSRSGSKNIQRQALTDSYYYDSRNPPTQPNQSLEEIATTSPKSEFDNLGSKAMSSSVSGNASKKSSKVPNKKNLQIEVPSSPEGQKDGDPTKYPKSQANSHSDFNKSINVHSNQADLQNDADDNIKKGKLTSSGVRSSITGLKTFQNPSQTTLIRITTLKIVQ